MIAIDFSDKRPINEQIIVKVIDLAAKGFLPPGSPLPSVRSLATELSINPNTVQKAYAELERLGVILSVRGRGSIIAENNDPLRKMQADKLHAALREAVEAAKHLGISCEEVCGEIKKIYEKEGDRK